ncbi:MAG: hypothetical protein AAGL24_20925 [Pseudomonadota bacterium]
MQIVLYAGIGFFLALLLGVLVYPAFRNRTVRLTERRLKAELPQSMEEIRADRDSVRAEYALSMRQLEIKMEKLEEEAVARKLLLENREGEIRTLKTDIRQKQDIISELGDDLDDQRDRSSDKDEELSRARSKVRDIAGRLERKIKDLERSETRLAEMEKTVETQRAELLETRATLRNSERYGQATVPALVADGAGHVEAETKEQAAADGRIEPKLGGAAKAGGDTVIAKTVPAEGTAADKKELDRLHLQVTELQAAKLAAELRATTAEDQLASLDSQVSTLEEKLRVLKQEQSAPSGGESGDGDTAAVAAEQARLENRIASLEADLQDKQARIRVLESGDGGRHAGEPSGDNEALRAQLLEIEAEKASFEAEVTRLTLALETARATAVPTGDDGATDRLREAEQDLAAVRAERDEALSRVRVLDADLQNMKALEGASQKIEQAEITLLRDSLSDLAADVTRMIMTMEGKGSTIDDLLAKSNGADRPDAAVMSLAERIKSLQERSASSDAG